MVRKQGTGLVYVHDPVSSLIAIGAAEAKICIVKKVTCTCDGGAEYTCSKFSPQAYRAR